MQLSVVIPVYRSARIIPTLVERIGVALASAVDSFEIVLVNDASPDESWSVIQSLAALAPNVKGINLRRNAGQHNAIMAGLNNCSGEIIVVMDDDLQHDPADILLLVDKVREDCDVCFARFRELRHAWWKRLGSAFNDVVARVLLKKPSDIYLSSFKAFTNGIRDEVIRYTGPYVYLDGLILMTTSSLSCVDVQHHGRHEGCGSYTFRKSVSLWIKMATSFSVLPLRIASVLGVLFALLGFILAVAAVLLKLLSGFEVPIGWTSLITVILLIGGVQLFSLGVIGEYLGRTYVQMNNVPQYSIRSKVNI